MVGGGLTDGMGDMESSFDLDSIDAISVADVDLDDDLTPGSIRFGRC